MSSISNSGIKTEDHLHLVYSDSVLCTGRDDHGSYFASIADGQDDEEEDNDDDDTEPPRKKCRRPDVPDDDDDGENLPSLQQVLSDLNRSMCPRLDSIEGKLRTLDERTKYLETQMGEILQQHYMRSQTAESYPSVKTSSGAIIIGVPQERSTDEDSAAESASGFDGGCRPSNSFTMNAPDVCSLGPNVTLITLNTAEDYPNGCWLGSEELPDQRVRVPISQSDLLHIESNCRTPEKMALALLDYLFDRDTQACSNLSGLGRHGKKKLDPLFIYGLRCHLVNRFGITERAWHRIKLNIDSKCRTAFRRKMRGQPLTVKAFRGKVASTYVQVGQPIRAESDEDTNSMPGTTDSVLQINEGGDVTQTVQLLTNNQFQVITATPEQVARLKPRIQLVQDRQYIAGLSLGGADGLVTLSADDAAVSIVTTENGDMIQIMSDSDVNDAIGHETRVPQAIV